MNIALYNNLPSGGAKRSLYEEVRRLRRRHSIHSFAPSTANQDFCDFSEYVATNTVVPYRLSRRVGRPLGRLNNAILLLDLIRLSMLERNLARKIDADGYDVVLVHPSQWTQAPALLRWLKTPSVYYCHESLRHLYEPGPAESVRVAGWRSVLASLDPLPKTLDSIVGRNDRLATQAATCVATNSRFTASEIRRIYGVQALVAYHGVDTEVFRPLDLEREAFVLSVGALMPHKGFGFVIRSLALVSEQRRPPLVIVSNFTSPDERRRLDALVSSQAVQVTFRSQVSVQELVQLYNQCQLVVYAPYDEPFGLVPLEAMACGTLVVAVDEGGPAESIDNNKTGILVGRRERAFAQTVDRLLQDPTARECLGRQALEHVRRFWTWEQAVQRLEQILLDAAQGTPQAVAADSSCPCQDRHH